MAELDLDATDRALLARLIRDGRATFQDLADAVRLRRPSVHERVKKLERAGIVRGYHAHVDPDKVGAGLVAYVFLKMEPCSGPEGRDCMTRCNDAAKRLERMPEVVEFHTVAGQQDVMVKVRVADVRELERVVMREISGTPGVAGVETRVVLRTHFERPVQVREAPAVVAPRRRGRSA